MHNFIMLRYRFQIVIFKIYRKRAWNGECKIVESFTHQITLYEALWEMNSEENNNLSFAMVYVENTKIIFHYSKEEIIPMVSYKW